MSAEEGRPRILFATIAAGGGRVAGAWAMAESVEHHYPARYGLRVSDYTKEVGAGRLDRFHKKSWRCALRYPILVRAGQRIIDAFPRLTITAERRNLRRFARAAAYDLGEDPPLLVVSNHGLITVGLAEAKHRYGLEVRVLTFATEPFNISAYWAEPRVESVIVASENGRRRLIHFGMPAEKMIIFSAIRCAKPSFMHPARSRFARAWGSTITLPAYSPSAEKG